MLGDAQDLAGRLYRYNTEPASPEWRRRLGSRQAIRTALALDRLGGALTPSATGVWLFWHGQRRMPARQSVFKLYVSPETAQLRECLDAVLGTVEARRMIACKTGGDIHNLLRPDKLLVYFATRDDALETGDALLTRLRGTPAHGVPFTAEIGGGGLLSWGVDPPRAPARSSDGRSWRRVIVGRLADSLIEAHAGGSHGRPAIAAALRSLRISGIDPETWTPRASQMKRGR